MASYKKPEFDIRLEEVADGIQVTQHGRTYLARKWQLTPNVRSVIDSALQHGLTCLWQTNHPRGETSHHISFSFTHSKASWVFVIGSPSAPPELKRVIFSKRLKPYFESLTWRWDWEWEKGGGQDIFVDPNDLDGILDALPLEQMKREAFEMIE